MRSTVRSNRTSIVRLFMLGHEGRRYSGGGEKASLSLHGLEEGVQGPERTRRPVALISSAKSIAPLEQTIPCIEKTKLTALTYRVIRHQYPCRLLSGYRANICSASTASHFCFAIAHVKTKHKGKGDVCSKVAVYRNPCAIIASNSW